MVSFFTGRGYPFSSLENDLQRVATIIRPNALCPSKQRSGSLIPPVQIISSTKRSHSFNGWVNSRYLLWRTNATSLATPPNSLTPARVSIREATLAITSVPSFTALAYPNVMSRCVVWPRRWNKLQTETTWNEDKFPARNRWAQFQLPLIVTRILRTQLYTYARASIQCLT